MVSIVAAGGAGGVGVEVGVAVGVKVGVGVNVGVGVRDKLYEPLVEERKISELSEYALTEPLEIETVPVPSVVGTKVSV